MALTQSSEHRFSWWHQGIFVFDRDYEWSESFDEYTEISGDWLDQSRSGGVTFISPGGAVFDSEDAPLRLEVHDAAPPVEQDAETVGEFDLQVRSGVLVLEESGGGERRTEVPAPCGTWRARWSGFGELALEEQDFGERGVRDPRPDRYLLQLWPSAAPAPLARLKD